MDSLLSDSGPISRAFLDRGISSFKDACRLVQGLSYGRIGKTGEPLRVLRERRGTCSSKHTLLALLAKECGLPLQLTIGIYLMDGINTPGVGPVLKAFGHPFLPEAHCYLICRRKRLDFTRTAGLSIDSFLVERQIDPGLIDAEKVTFHQEFLCRFYGVDRLQEIWRIREACIEALYETNPVYSPTGQGRGDGDLRTADDGICTGS